MSLTPAVDGIAKGLGESYSPMFIAFLRYLGAGIVALAFAVATRQRLHVPRSDYPGQVFRTALIMGAMTALIAALALVPLANAVGGFLIAPIVSTVLSVVLMGEKIDDLAIGWFDFEHCWCRHHHATRGQPGNRHSAGAARRHVAGVLSGGNPGGNQLR